MQTCIIVAGLLQGIGTLLLGLFSFCGLEIKPNPDAYIEGVQAVSIKRGWLVAAQIGLFALFVGIVISTITSYQAAG